MKQKRSNKACNSNATGSISSGNLKSNLEVMHLQVALKSGDIWPFDSKKWDIQSLVFYQCSSLVCCTSGLTWKKKFSCPIIWFPVLPETYHFYFLTLSSVDTVLRFRISHSSAPTCPLRRLSLVPKGLSWPWANWKDPTMALSRST